MSGRIAETSAIFALALILTLVIGLPVMRAPSARLFGMEIVGRHHDPFTAIEQFGRPLRDLIGGVYSQPFTDVPGALIARATGPVAAYNWLVLLTFPLSAVAAYLLARQLLIGVAGSTIAAVAFAFSPFHFGHAAYHPHIAQTQWIPLYFIALWRCLDDSTPSALGLLACAVVGAALSNFYAGLITATITPVAIAGHYLFMSGREGSRRRLALTVAMLVAVGFLGLGYAWYAAHGVVVNRAAFAFGREDLFRYSAKWWGYLVPPVENPLLGSFASRIWNRAGVHVGLLEQQVSLGWGLVGLALAGTFAWPRRDRRESALSAIPMLVSVAVIALICSLSPERTIGGVTFVRPSAALYAIVPMFRAYARFGVVVQLMVALLAGIGSQWLWQSGSRARRIACVSLLTLTAGEYAVWPPDLSRDVLPTSAHRWVADQRIRIRALDCAPLTPESESITWLSGYRVALGGGWFEDCTEPHLAGKLAAAGYTHLIVRRSTSEGVWFASRGTPDGLQRVAQFADGDVLAVSAGTPLVYTARFAAFYPREYNTSWTWRWMGAEAAWKIANTSDRPLVGGVEIEMSAFHEPRRMTVLLDGSTIDRVVVPIERGLIRIAPVPLTPGVHDLVFRPAEPPTVAADLIGNGDRRALSFAFGTWRWTVEGSQP